MVTKSSFPHSTTPRGRNEQTSIFKRKCSDWLEVSSAILTLTYNFETSSQLSHMLQVSSKPTQVSISVLFIAVSTRSAMIRFNRQVFQVALGRASSVQQRSIHTSSLSTSELVNGTPSALPNITSKPTNDSEICVPKVFPGQAIVWLVKSPWDVSTVSTISREVDKVNEDYSTQIPAQTNTTRGTEQSLNRPVEIVTIWPHLW